MMLRLSLCWVALWGCQSAGGDGGGSALPGDDAPSPSEAGPVDLGEPVDGGAAGDGDLPMDGAVPDAAAPVAVCAGWAFPTSVGLAGDPALLEASGVVTSRVDPDRLWLHNDSGDDGTLYALSALDGSAVGRFPLDGVNPEDQEDLAAAPCPDDGAPCLWIGDVGDNEFVRDDAELILVAEPAAGATPGPLRPRMRLPIRYPDGPVNVEALLVAGDGQTFWLIEKGGDFEQTRIFEGRGPFRDDVPVAVTVAGTFAAPGIPVPEALGRLVTGADLRADGRQVLVRVYTGTYAYSLAPGQTPADLGAVQPIRAASGPLSELQGEAVGYAADGLSFFTVSEVPEGTTPPRVNHYVCDELSAP